MICHLDYVLEHRTYIVSYSNLDIIRQLNADGSEGVTVHAFIAFSKNHPEILEPCLRAQKIIQTRVLGLKTWEKYTRMRDTLSRGEFVVMPVILVRPLHVHLMNEVRLVAVNMCLYCYVISCLEVLSRCDC